MYYPNAPGHQNTGTSIKAAGAIKSKAITLSKRSLNLLSWYPAGLTPDEIAFILRESVLAIRPRITELKQLGFVYDTGLRRRNQSGRWAAIIAKP